LLACNAGFEYWVDWYEARLRGEPVPEWEAIQGQILLPEEVLAQGSGRINAYLLDLRAGIATPPLNRVRAIFIGPGGAGKTSLIRALHGEPVDPQVDHTPGIEIRESRFVAAEADQGRYQAAPADSPDLVVHFWDFGGQVMYHATHQFFLRSNCVYMVVLDGRKAEGGGGDADFWLEHVSAVASEAQVLMVCNKVDQGPPERDPKRLREKYPNIRPGGFFSLSCTGLAEKGSLLPPLPGLPRGLPGGPGGGGDGTNAFYPGTVRYLGGTPPAFR
jgi:signal recognition particle receptor subunit beta